MNPSNRFTVPNPPIASESFGDEAVIVNLEQGTYYSVRGTAYATWSLVSTGVAIGTIVGELAASYDAPTADIEAAVAALLAEMEHEGLIVRADGDASSAQLGPEPPVPRSKHRFERPVLEKFTDVQDLLALDPIHDVDGTGWPQPRAEHGAASDTGPRPEIGAGSGEDEDRG
jgi:hypothetical protein